MARTIEEFAKERGIRYLLHFTRLSNLQSILTHGLVCRDRLDGRNIMGTVNDQHRLDGTDAVCVSIAFPNYKMFYRCRCEHPEEEWVVVAIQPKALWELPCAFCVTNAASNRVTAIPLIHRTGLAAFQAMYEDYDDKIRATLKLADSMPTNPQAEVLMLDGVPRSYIMGVAVPNFVMKAQIEALYEGVSVRKIETFFSPRDDHHHWKQQ
ncbi:DarT ssDNA thymidine ADP-ribosyltransferase family protein [Burkholderia multivorans]|uniref:DarT ssDNA thymidine ADP-ribosyltransferase family protein n=1 Tax=Burkholderia multivorans TaxID=87883 RepID=UPI001C264ACC|nr:DarT ssDNA thymidine ADP-ribosyltransferase family protein [Burkholderia multivorans]MBU9547503.1 DUF4433 domain-containing protein [Burkholderia multivorans]